MKKGRYVDAFKTMNRLRKHPIIAARDLYYSHVLFEEEKEISQDSTYLSRLADCFRIPRIRRANLAASVVMLSQQMCGINVISFYSSTVFKEGGYSDEQALYASLGFGAVSTLHSFPCLLKLNFAFAIPAIFIIDTFGRRALLLSTFPGMAITLLGTGLSFLMPEEPSTTRTSVIAMFIYLFTAFYSIGEGPVCFLYGAEVFPNIQREQGMAWAVTINMFFAAVLGLTFPAMKTAMTPLGAFCFYAGTNVVSFVLIFLFVPETKALSLEELDDVFSIPTKTFIQYQTKSWLPYFFKRYILRKKVAPLTPLHAVHKGGAGYGV
jgi:MFS family permease